MRRLSPLFAPALLAAVLGCREDADSPTAPEATPSLAISATQALAFSQVSGGDRHTCGVTTDNRAYCWGVNDYGQLGDGTTTYASRRCHSGFATLARVSSIPAE
jgi:alpha-tubulin suppressor-like RCC1 family protein